MFFLFIYLLQNSSFIETSSIIEIWKNKILLFDTNKKLKVKISSLDISHINY